MAFDFLNQTTYDNDPLATGELANMVYQQLAQRQAEEEQSMQEENATEPGEGLHNGSIDPDLADLINNNSDKIYDILTAPDEKPDDNSDINPENFDFTNDQMTADDMDMYSYLLGDDAPTVNSNRTSIADVAASVGTSNNLSWLKTKSSDVNLNGINSNISKYLDSLPDNIKDDLVATSGDDGDEHVEGSAHYQHNAVDLRWNPKAWDYIQNDPTFQQLGLKTIQPNHGTAKHIHIQTKQFGGGVLVADTQEEQFKGLNDTNYRHAIFNVGGQNTFRGLDNNQPVFVTDGSKYRILKGKNDTDTFNGKVYEKRL